MRKRLVGALGFALVLVVGVSAVAMAANTNVQHLSQTFKPTKVPKNKRAGGSISILSTTDTTLTGALALKPVTNAKIFFDKDLAFFTTGYKQCNPALIAGTTTEVAKQKCGSSLVGIGTGKVQIAGDPNPANTVQAKITAFNGKQVNGRPVVLLHARVDAIASTVVLNGVLQNTSAPYGTMLQINVPVLPAGSALNFLEVKIQKSFKYKGKQRNYVSAQCSHSNRKWKIKGTYNYAGHPPLTVTSTQGCQVKK